LTAWPAATVSPRSGLVSASQQVATKANSDLETLSAAPRQAPPVCTQLTFMLLIFVRR